MTKSLLQRNVQPSDIGISSSETAKNESPAPLPRTSSRRAGDSSIGRPDASSGNMPAENETRPSCSEPENIAVPGESIEDCEATGFFAPAWICKVLRTCLLFFSAAAAFCIVTQTASFLADARQLSMPEIIILSIPLIGFGLVIVWVILRMIVLFIRLRVSPQIRIKALQELEERRQLRKYSLKMNQDAIRKLSSFLRDSFSVNEKKLCSFGFSGDEVLMLKKDRERLIRESENLSGTTRDWIEDFRRKIQDPLDRMARKRIRHYSLNAAVMAGISPFPMIDRLIVFSACISMLKDLLELYALKPSWDKNLVLMGQVIINTYLAGVIEDVTEAGIDGISNLAEDAAEKIPDFALRGAGKAAETAMHGYMVYRLGKSAMKVLHPVSVPEDRSIASALINRMP